MGITHKDIPAFTKTIGTRDRYFIVWYEVKDRIETATCETTDEVEEFVRSLQDAVGPVLRVAVQRIDREQLFLGTVASLQKNPGQLRGELCGHPGCGGAIDLLICNNCRSY